MLETDGEESCVASASIAASAALADAGFEMLGLVAACSACLLPYVPFTSAMDVDSNAAADNPGSPEIWLDPTAEESARSSGALIMACIPALGTVTNIRQTGLMTTGTAEQVNNFPFQH